MLMWVSVSSVRLDASRLRFANQGLLHPEHTLLTFYTFSLSLNCVTAVVTSCDPGIQSGSWSSLSSCLISSTNLKSNCRWIHLGFRWQQSSRLPNVDQRLHWFQISWMQQIVKLANVDKVHKARIEFLVCAKVVEWL